MSAPSTAANVLAVERVVASSILKRNAKLFSPGNVLLDDDSCWNSEPGVPQWIELRLAVRSSVHAVQLAFQGGFVGKHCTLEVDAAPDGEPPAWTCVAEFGADDVNDVQRFTVPPHFQLPLTRTARITFHASTDFYGRITLYRATLLGG